jgi:hypothetical protein
MEIFIVSYETVEDANFHRREVLANSEAEASSQVASEGHFVLWCCAKNFRPATLEQAQHILDNPEYYGLV